LSDVLDKVDAIQQELNLLVEDITDCLDTRVRGDLNEAEILSLIRENINFKRRVQELNRKIILINNRLISIDDLYRKKKESGPKIKYKSAKGDAVDALFADYINNTECPVPL